jgi:hypothetical protein
MRRSSALALTATLGLGLAGCDILAGLIDFADLDVLGVIPKAGFSSASSADYGKVVFALGAADDGGFSLAPPLQLLQFSDEEGNPIEVEEGEEIPGSDAGTFVLLVDGSSSMLTTDPARYRVEAARQVAVRIDECSDHWDQALLEFTTDAPGGKYEHSRMLADFGAPVGNISENADGLDASGSTPLWDATIEVLKGLADHAEDHEQELYGADEGAGGSAGEGDPGAEDPAEGGSPVEDAPPAEDPLPDEFSYGRSLVVISDGADTASWKDLDRVIEVANNAGIHVHAIGLGPASDAETGFGAEPQAIADLRRLALETGGTYGYVSTADELPQQADAIAKAVCGGYTELTAHFADPKPSGERINGRVTLIGTDLGVPFTFTAP